MGKINTTDINTWVNGKAANTPCHFLPNLPLKPAVQTGPNCGFYCLQFVFDYWTDQGHPPTNREKYTARSRDGGISLRFIGKIHGALHLPVEDGTTPTPAFGGVYRAEYLGNTAAQIPGFVARTCTAGGAQLTQKIQKAIDKNWPCIVALDCNDLGDPGSYGGERAHWGTVVGYFTDGGELRYLAAPHGGAAEYFEWKAADLQMSNSQLITETGAKWAKVRIAGPHRGRFHYDWNKLDSGGKLKPLPSGFMYEEKPAGKVQAVDTAALKITLRGGNGKDYSFQVAPDVKVSAGDAKDLSSIQKGALVILTLGAKGVTKIQDEDTYRYYLDRTPDIQMDLSDKIVLVVPQDFQGELTTFVS